MAYDMYLQIDGIPGDSTDSKHKDWIEVTAFSQSISQAGGGSSSAHGAHGSGKVDIQDVSFIKKLDAGSPNLYKFCCDGKHIAKVTFECCRATGEKTVFFKIVLEDVIISSVSTSGGSGGSDSFPPETVTMRFAKINWEFTPTDSKGKPQAAKKSGWNLGENKAI